MIPLNFWQKREKERRGGGDEKSIDWYNNMPAPVLNAVQSILPVHPGFFSRPVGIKSATPAIQPVSICAHCAVRVVADTRTPTAREQERERERERESERKKKYGKNKVWEDSSAVATVASESSTRC